MNKILLYFAVAYLTGCTTTWEGLKSDATNNLNGIATATQSPVSHQHEMSNFIFIKDGEFIPFHEALYRCNIPASPNFTITETPCAAFENVAKVKTHAVYQWQQPEGTHWMMDVAIADATLQGMKEIGPTRLPWSLDELKGRISQLAVVSLDKQGIDILRNQIGSLEVQFIPEKQKVTTKIKKSGKKK